MCRISVDEPLQEEAWAMLCLMVFVLYCGIDDFAYAVKVKEDSFA